MALHSAGEPRYLIVNADDFGYFPCVSSGIVEGVRAGVISATSVMANRVGLETQIAPLLESTGVDIGVHLNLTSGRPLTGTLRRRFGKHGLPGKSWWALRLPIRGPLLCEITEEFAAQIDRCVALGVSPVFLNSHEHVHMLPGIYGAVVRLARERRIQFVRHSAPDWGYATSSAGVVRNALIQGLSWLQRPDGLEARMPRMLGLSVSGRLGLQYLEALGPRLAPDAPAELMCHPGWCESGDISDSALTHYHHWNQELAALLSPEFAALREQFAIEIVGYRHFV